MFPYPREVRHFKLSLPAPKTTTISAIAHVLPDRLKILS
jgi:hypothetical protein